LTAAMPLPAPWSMHLATPMDIDMQRGRYPRSLTRAMMDSREEVRELIAQLEQQRSRLKEVQLRARRQGGPEGQRLQAQAEARLRDIDERINGLKASLE
jgi:hypothetical protein